MLKTSSTKSAEPKNSVVKIGIGGRNRAEPVGKHKLDGGDNNGGSCSGNSNGNLLNAPKLVCPFAPFTSMLRTNLLTDSLTSTAQIGIDYDRVDDGAITSILRTSTSTDSLASAAHIVVEFDGFDASSDAGGKSVKKLVKKLSNGRRIIKESKKPQKPEKLQRSSVWRNVYRGTNPPSKNSNF